MGWRVDTKESVRNQIYKRKMTQKTPKKNKEKKAQFVDEESRKDFLVNPFPKHFNKPLNPCTRQCCYFAYQPVHTCSWSFGHEERFISFPVPSKFS